MENLSIGDYKLTTIDHFDENMVMHKIKLAYQFRDGFRMHYKRPVYCTNLFFENSTRTKTSFEMAEAKLGLKILDFDVQHSSVSKGETLDDTLLTLQALGVDIAVVRHPQNKFYRSLNPDNSMGLINGGDGSGQHPSQTLLDMFTIYDEFQNFANLKILIAGDLIHSRVAHSNAKLLKKLGAQIFFSGPVEWYGSEFDQLGTYVDIDDVIDQVDVVMLLRIQTERFDASQNDLSVDQYLSKYGLTKQRAEKMKPTAIIMHPAPVNRGTEIEGELVESSASRIFQQMTNGVFMRMAIITDILRTKGLIESEEFNESAN